MKIFYICFEGFGYHGGQAYVLAATAGAAADILQRCRMKQYINSGYTEEEILRTGKTTKIEEITNQLIYLDEGHCC